MALQNPDSQSNLGEDKKSGYTYEGKEIVISKTRGRPVDEGKGIYGIPDAKRIEVATLYAVTGDIKKVAEISGLPVSTVRSWRSSDWFKKLLSDIRDENDEKIDSKFTEIINKSLDLIQERLENGDFVVAKNGELVRKPVGVRDLSITSAINFDKRQLVRGKPTSRTETITNQEQLVKLAKQFKELANKGKQKPLEIQDVEFTEIIRDEGPEEPTPSTS